jgi:hypothetical protein
LFVTNALPSSAPKPLTIFTTPEEGYHPSIKTKIEIGVLSAGFRTTVPAANAGASFQIAINIGKFQE